MKDLRKKAEFEDRLRQRDSEATQRRHGGQDVAEEHAPLDKGLNFREKVRACPRGIENAHLAEACPSGIENAHLG